MNSIDVIQGIGMKMIDRQNKIRGCLLGGAVGDALGYPVEFLPWTSILKEYGDEKVSGIREYSLDPESGKALFSDDTQMTLFTANGILVNETEKELEGAPDRLNAIVYKAYTEWFNAQKSSIWRIYKERICWLMDDPTMYKNRAPGFTCTSALGSGICGSVNNPINDSKGCGGVMRVAPYGCFFRDMQEKELVFAGSESAAITHGNSLGYIPAGMLGLIVRDCVCEENRSLREIIEHSLTVTEKVFSRAIEWSTFSGLMEKALALTVNESLDAINIHALGTGFSGHEALAVAIYCSVKYANDFSSGVIAAVNHDGDSDSTGAITGNILGAYLGIDHIEKKWIEPLEDRRVILELADDLYYGVPGKDEQERLMVWRQKYLDKNYKVPE